MVLMLSPGDNGPFVVTNADPMTGPGTMTWRFTRFLDLLQARYPDPEPCSARGYEGRFLEWLDDLIKRDEFANGRLITAAPELLAALKALLEGRPELWGDEVHNGITDFPIDEAALFAADVAIAKAEGREP